MRHYQLEGACLFYWVPYCKNQNKTKPKQLLLLLLPPPPENIKSLHQRSKLRIFLRHIRKILEESVTTRARTGASWIEVTHYRRSYLALQICALYLLSLQCHQSMEALTGQGMWLKLAAVSISHILFVVGVLDQTFFQYRPWCDT